ncbi:MAG: transporter substrate-binding domain-containing protein [Planctomycetota bacterium]|jgi:ABC-type amino acid transport substrate-binding protein
MRCTAYLVLVLILVLPTAALAEEELTVGVKEAPPFVMRDDAGTAKGFSVDLVREIASRFDPPRRIRLEWAPDLSSHLADVAAGRVDLAIAATSITAAREQQVDFSNPFFRDALDVVVPERGSGVRLWDALLQSDVPNVLLALLVFVVAVSHLIWFLERGDGGFSRSYVKGVGQGVWWTVVTMSTVGYGDFVPKKVHGRGLGVAVIFVGIVMFGIAVASLTAAATAQQITSPIERLSDLAGMRVGAIPESIGAQELARRGIRAQSVPSTAAGMEAVRDGRLDAFVHDRSQLLYALSKAPGTLMLVNRPFAQQSYAIAFPIGSPLRKEVNVVLQRLTEGDDAPYDAIYQRWFPTR